MKTQKYGVLLIAIIVVSFGGIVAEACNTLLYCASCPNYPTCDTCMNQPYMGKSVTGLGCRDCLQASSRTCNKCETLSRCSECVDSRQGPVHPTTEAMCAACAPNCWYCHTNGAGKCDVNRCNTGYELDSNNMCKPNCAPNCQYCGTRGAGKCDYLRCDAGYYTHLGSMTCVPCMLPDCMEPVCGTPTTCNRCRPGFGTLTPTEQRNCYQCNTKYGCSVCATLTQCTKCSNTTLGPLFDGSGKCAPCAPNCKLCIVNGGGKCDTCNSGFVLQPDKTCLKSTSG